MGAEDGAGAGVSVEQRRSEGSGRARGRMIRIRGSQPGRAEPSRDRAGEVPRRKGRVSLAWLLGTELPLSSALLPSGASGGD